MKARVKATGEIGIVSQIDILLKDDFISFSPNNVELLTNYADASIEHSFDYWTRLEHQYAGMAMQGILTNPIGFENIRARGTNIQIETALLASEFAHALVEKMKEEK